ncbi:MAG TPA: DUF5996 family protein [Solirubrobacteraceae bacterium]|nr:DUF5996 family protein [Solirubrobacteraceae bacterium]
MQDAWPDISYPTWRATCDTLHAHTQILGKLCVALAPPEPQLQHAALRLTARGWETGLLPAPDGSGGLVVGLDLRRHEAFAEHSAGARRRLTLGPGRSVGQVCRDLVAAVRELAGDVSINATPQEVSWTVPLDEDEEHVTYDRDQVENYLAAATRAALVLAAFRAPYRGRATPVNAWWGSFDLAVNLFSGAPAGPPAADFIMRNAMDSQEVAVGWWPGDSRYQRAAFYAYAHPAPEELSDARLTAGRWAPELGEFVLDWEEAGRSSDPSGSALRFAQEVFQHACVICDWDPGLAASAAGDPPPVA